MKKFNLTLVCFVLVISQLFVSCESDELLADATISFSTSGTVSGDAEIAPGQEFTIELTAKKGDDNMEYFTLKRDADNIPAYTITGFKSSDGTERPVELKKDDEDLFSITITMTSEVNVGDYEYFFTVLDKDENVLAENSITLTVKEPTTSLAEAIDFEFKRIAGADATGMEVYGLAWTTNSETSAIIKKDADKLVILSLENWNDITTQEALKLAVDNANGLDTFEDVSATASSSTNYVIATKKDDSYYILKILNSTVTTSEAGTTITISGQSKE
ncbi:MAG: hypothetical protein HRT66_05640 [Flavobacteriaceae bacterium]|nr:hypothetical protein [Flavobacteriaceae bacterium]